MNDGAVVRKRGIRASGLRNAVVIAVATVLCTCGCYWLSPIGSAQPVATIPGDGMFRVGADIQPGTYRSAGPSGDVSCSWNRLSALSRRTEAWIDSGTSNGQQYVTIAPTDVAFWNQFCQPWTLVSPSSAGGTESIPQQSNFAVAPGTVINAVPGMGHGERGGSCSNLVRYIFATASDGTLLACTQGGAAAPYYVLSAPLVGVRQEGAPCQPSTVAQSPDGEPMLCLASGGQNYWWAAQP